MKNMKEIDNFNFSEFIGFKLMYAFKFEREVDEYKQTYNFILKHISCMYTSLH